LRPPPARPQARFWKSISQESLGAEAHRIQIRANQIPLFTIDLKRD
jgi:hypothetical protein